MATTRRELLKTAATATAVTLPAVVLAAPQDDKPAGLARGGVLQRPATMPMVDEIGPDAILPLRWSPDGRLGV